MRGRALGPAERSRALDGEAHLEFPATGCEAEALGCEVVAEADLLVLARPEPALRQAAQVVAAPRGLGPGGPAMALN
eukprot:15443189-Alexandrium_andersonii.AAC.1